MKLYICGNGFDLHHGFKTSYLDYRNFLLENYSQSLKSFEDYPYIGLEQIDESRWSDLESALTIDYAKCMSEAISNYYPDLTDDSDSRWNGIDIDLEEQTKFVYDFTGRYFEEWLTSVDFSQYNAPMKIDKNALFITFNYTETLENLYGVNPSNVLHIHGNIDTNNLQFGSIENNSAQIRRELENSYGEDDFYNVSIEPGVNHILSYCQASSKQLENNYEALYKFIVNRDIDEIVILGHSILGVDFAYYRDIIVPLLCTLKWTICVHSKIDEFDAMKFIRNFNIQSHEILDW